MDGCVNEDRVGPFGAEAVDSFLAAVSGAIVHDPEDAASGLVLLLAHDFADGRSTGAIPFLTSQRPNIFAR